MKYRTTRNGEPFFQFSQAVESGLGPDGGLFVPLNFPHFDPEDFAPETPISQLAGYLLSPFVNEDPYFPGAKKFFELCQRAFSFPLRISKYDSSIDLLELFHGPTAAFKDFGARFLAEWISLLAVRDQKTRTVLVATSGDTGGAVASAFFQKPGIEVLILFPKDKVSPFQQSQLTTWGSNIKAFAIDGTFDDCQRIVKEAFSNSKIQQRRTLLSANSINIARLLPQMVYHAWAALQLHHQKRDATWVVPSGNLGNAVSAIWAREIGFPISRLIMAFNANLAVPNYFQTHKWLPHSTLSTLANAMDVGSPSNMERLLFLFPDASKEKWLGARSINDDQIRQTLRNAPTSTLVCPHTAVGITAAQADPKFHYLVTATAHPGKFEEVIFECTGRHTPLPQVLLEHKNRPSQFSTLPASLDTLPL